MGKFLLIALIGVSAACSSKVASDSEAFLPGRRLAELTNKRLEEASGLEASRQNPSYIWVHNDSGNAPEIFLIDSTLNVKLTCILGGISNRDWEDISVGPGPDPAKSYVYVADIGDNFAQYQYKHIYRFEEPIFDPAQTEITISAFDTITFQLPAERKDTETLFIDPASKDLYVVSKREEPVHVYELKYPYSTKDTITAKDIATLPMTQIVAGDFSDDGTELLLKNYKNVFYWKVQGKKTIEEILKGKPSVLKYREEPQGEAIAWALDKSGFYTLSEKVKNKKSFLYFYKRK
jgi:hypothetical protein